MADANWYDGMNLDEENIGLIQTKGWGDANSIIKSYRELEKYTGADKNDFIRIPKAADGETPDYSEVFSKLGRPENADGYDLTDSDFSKAAREALFKAGITKSQAKQLEEWINGYSKTKADEDAAKAAAELDLRNKASAEELRKEWGADTEKNYAIVQNTRKDLGISDEAFDAMVEKAGPKVVAELLLRASTKSDADAPLSNYNNHQVETKEMAKLKISQMQNDPEIIKKLAEGDAKVTEEFNRLAALTVTGQ
jgi:hypothetical protein